MKELIVETKDKVNAEYIKLGNELGLKVVEKTFGKDNIQGYLIVTKKKIEDFLESKARGMFNKNWHVYERCLDSYNDGKEIELILNASRRIEKAMAIVFRVGIVAWLPIGCILAAIYDKDIIALGGLLAEFVWCVAWFSYKSIMIDTFRRVKVVWNEILFQDYLKFPPLGVLERVKEEKSKKIFDYFTVVTVATDDKMYKDPLLFGRIKGSEVRYFLMQWDNDVNIDDVV